MKKLVLPLLVLGVINLCSAQQAFYDVIAANGNGVRFWGGSDNWKIHMGNAAEYHYGPVTDYSIKINMDGTAGRGWTWGNTGLGVPVAALSNQGNMQIAGSFQSRGITVSGSASVEETILNASNLSDQDFNVRVSGAGAATKRTIIGPSTSGRFSLGVGVGNGNEYLTILNGGNVGIGNSSPSQKLEITGNLRINGPTSGLTHSQIQFYRGDGGKFATIGQGDLNSSNSTFDIQHYNGNDIRFLQSGTEQLRILASNGNVGIGTSNPDYKLTVNGSIHAKEVRVDLNVPGPDYVFANDYKLPSLEEIKNYIDENKHLPEVPSAAAMEKNGVQLGEMNMLLLKKIEELTLYVIELKKRDETQQKEIEELKNKIK